MIRNNNGSASPRTTRVEGQPNVTARVPATLSGRKHPSAAAAALLSLGVFTLFPLSPASASGSSDIPYAEIDQTSFARNVPTATYFLANPVAAHAPVTAMVQDGDVALPPLPDALKPLGPAKVAPTPRQESIIAELPPAHGLPSDPENKSDDNETVAAKPADAPDSGTIVMETPKPSATNAFLDWVRAHQDAEDLARQQRKQYHGDDAANPGGPAPAGTQKPRNDSGGDGEDSDLLLNIRYPYTWNQEAPSGHGSSVIYTVPKR